MEGVRPQLLVTEPTDKFEPSDLQCTSPFDKHVQIYEGCFIRTDKTYTVNANNNKKKKLGIMSEG